MKGNVRGVATPPNWIIYLSFVLGGLRPWRVDVWYLVTLTVIWDSVFADLDYFPP